MTENSNIPEMLNAFATGLYELGKGRDNTLISSVEQIAKLLPSQNKRRAQRSLKLADGFLACARADLQAASLLQENQMLSVSVYHLQQAVEKTTKAYALALNAITPGELRKIGHKSPLTFIRILRKRWAVKYIGILQSLYPDIKTNTSELETLIETKQEELAQLPRDVILKWMSLGAKIRSGLQSEDINKKIALVLDSLPNLLSNVVPANELESSLRTARANFDLGISLCFANLYILSVLTYPHFSFTRYPDGKILPSDYVSGLGIVDCEAEILPEVESTMAALDAYLKRRV
jgi:HEPN domain-containing protein